MKVKICMRQLLWYCQSWKWNPAQRGAPGWGGGGVVFCEAGTYFWKSSDTEYCKRHDIQTLLSGIRDVRTRATSRGTYDLYDNYDFPDKQRGANILYIPRIVMYKLRSLIGRTSCSFRTLDMETAIYKYVQTALADTLSNNSFQKLVHHNQAAFSVGCGCGVGYWGGGHHKLHHRRAIPLNAWEI